MEKFNAGGLNRASLAQVKAAAPRQPQREISANRLIRFSGDRL
ncbi:MAG: hypothetical protein R3C40_02710 [Parvularculaceae bacterium]